MGWERQELIQVHGFTSTTDKVICKDLCDLPDVFLKDHYDNLLFTVRQKAEDTQNEALLNWLEHKDRNPWILQCLSPATTQMSRADRFSTSTSTNIAELAHATSQREGTRLTLVAAIQKVLRLDSRFFSFETARETGGIAGRYGNTSITGRTKQNLKRGALSRKRKGKEAAVIQEDVLATARDLVDAGVSADSIELYLVKKST